MQSHVFFFFFFFLQIFTVRDRKRAGEQRPRTRMRYSFCFFSVIRIGITVDCFSVYFIISVDAVIRSASIRRFSALKTSVEEWNYKHFSVEEWNCLNWLLNYALSINNWLNSFLSFHLLKKNTSVTDKYFLFTVLIIYQVILPRCQRPTKLFLMLRLTTEVIIDCLFGPPSYFDWIDSTLHFQISTPVLSRTSPAWARLGPETRTPPALWRPCVSWRKLSSPNTLFSSIFWFLRFYRF